MKQTEKQRMSHNLNCKSIPTNNTVV